MPSLQTSCVCVADGRTSDPAAWRLGLLYENCMSVCVCVCVCACVCACVN